ncbi:MAG: histidine phosphatase family protein [Gammaproteobacteria bacterium]|nr:histidine phosphatase family protein [Gammaproteobacteria bacterium]
MKTLTIVRHAKSSWKNPGLGDRERPLNKRGERDAPIMGSRIAEAGIRPSLIVSSPAVRAWTTARIVARELTYPLEFLQREDELYLASVNDILDVIIAQDSGFNSLMIVGHNPGFTDFANYLSPGLTSNLPTAGVVSVDFDRDDWNLRDRPKTELILYDFPKNVR